MQLPKREGKIQFLIENTTVTVFIQKFVYGYTVILEKTEISKSIR